MFFKPVDVVDCEYYCGDLMIFDNLWNAASRAKHVDSTDSRLPLDRVVVNEADQPIFFPSQANVSKAERIVFSFGQKISMRTLI